jgi:hypothetical protein
MKELLNMARNGEGELLLAFAVLLGLTPEEIDRIIKTSRVIVSLEDEEEEKKEA